MSKVAGFVLGAIEVIAGAILTTIPGLQAVGIGLIISGAAMIVTQAVVDLTMPKAPARQASEMSIAIGEQPRSALFGEGFTAGSLVDAFDYGGKYGTDWEVLIIRLADHKCEGLTSFFVNDVEVNYTGNGAVPGYSGQLEIYFRSDTTTQALPAIVTTNGPHWSSGDRGESGCDVVVAYKADDPEDDSPIWPGGRPRFGFVLKGKLCYDPRLDSTVSGGSGSHRWDDPSTWEWSENPAVCRYNWARGIYANDDVNDPSKLLVGRGLSEAEAPPENIFAAANLCDEDPGDGSAVRYRVAGPVYSNQEHLEVEEMFAVACAGTVITREGSVELEPGQAKSVVMTFTDDDILVGSKVSWNEGILSESNPEWVNTVVARYVEPTQKWNDFAAPVVRSNADIFADGKPREASITLRLVKDQKQALRVAEINRRLGRLWGRAQVTLGPRFCETEDGDWIHWQSDRRFGGATKTFRVEAYSIDEKWQNSLTLREINSSVFGEDETTITDWTVVDTVDINAITNASTTLAGGLAVGVTLNGFDPDDIVRVSLPTGQTYTAWNPNINLKWDNRFDVIPDGVAANSFRVNYVGAGSPSSNGDLPIFNTAAAAQAAFTTQIFTGASSYTFWIYDSPINDNSGGLSILVERGRITSSLPDNSEVNPTDPPPAIGAPDAANWTLTPVTLSDGGVDTPALEITGDATDDTTAEAIIFEYWKDDGVIDPVANPDDPTWIQWGGLASRSTTKVDITGIEGGQDYYAAVTYVVSGFRGSRLVLGPVTAATIDVSGAVTPAINSAIAALSWKQVVRAKTAVALAANTYANGTSGVGATLTGNANGALAAVDGVTLVANDRVLVDAESSGSHNGIYTVTQVGDVSHPYILTRTPDADSGAELVNATVKVSEGSTFADQEWQCTTNATITVGTTALVWALASSGGGSSITSKDEGSTLTATTASINFVGGGVTATVSGSDVTVTIPGGAATGTSFPGSPSAGDLFFRTDRGIEFYYDGTRWLSVQLLTQAMPLSLTGGTASNTNVIEIPNPWAGVYDIYAVDFVTTFAAPTGTNWTGDLYKFDGASFSKISTTTMTGSGTGMTTTSTARDAINAVVTSTYEGFQINYTRSGTAANSALNSVLIYRLVG